MDLNSTVADISNFLRLNPVDVEAKLKKGFIPLHHGVAEDFRAANPTNDDELLEWYRGTEAYIWELSAYHLDPGFNYDGMIEGIAVHLQGLGKQKVLCLGDGVGDLSIRLKEKGLTPVYHDLKGGRTAEYAQSRFNGEIEVKLTDSWNPNFKASTYDAVVALDFFEHLTEVEAWTKNVVASLKVGGQFLAQNAFAIGDDEHGGSIPMHLTRNNRFEQDWNPLLESLNMVDQNNGWWVKQRAKRSTKDTNE